jgi:(1->4)-alpha-D-glucan 1-alpha-D-glucosylmutase
LRLRRDEQELFLSGAYMPLTTDVAVPAGVIAFARVLGNRAALFIAPRLFSAIVSNAQPVPLGGDAWKTSRIVLPPELHGRTFRNELTGTTILPASAGGDEWLFVGQVFETVPTAILRAE